MKKTASEGMVLCNGETRTSIGGTVYFPETATESELEKWQEMTVEEAEVLINPEPEEEATEADYLEALAELGVSE